MEEMRIFVSCEQEDRPPAALLIGRLRAESWCVDHSPCSRVDNHDPRWYGWYEHGLGEALDWAEVFIMVVTEGWDSSTWMAQEACYAVQSNSPHQVKHTFYWNPDRCVVTAAGVLPYLRTPLPEDLDALVDQLRTRESRSGAEFT